MEKYHSADIRRTIINVCNHNILYYHDGEHEHISFYAGLQK